ncbi:MAG: tetratricopeptide repeat protein [Alphaproteobacteria bacterium]|nr:tetratricopeptide repeat protein [Alphaproteobacteria bacterium]
MSHSRDADTGKTAGPGPSPGQVRRALVQASRLHQAGRLQEAGAVYGRILAARPDNDEALHLAGVLAHQSGAPKAAVRLIEQAIALNPEATAYHYNLGEALFEMGRFEEAAESYARVLERDPNVSDAHYRLGGAFYELGRHEESVASYRRAVALAPRDAEILHDMANPLIKLGRVDQGAEAFEQALALRPDYEEARARLDSLGYARTHFADAPRLPDRLALLEFALGQAPADGLVLEFGVAGGASLRHLAGLVQGEIHGFDSFEGLPEDWRAEFPKGTFADVERPDDLPANAKLVVGWFADSLPPFAAAHPGPVRFLHVDCDLYGSTKTVFDTLGDRIVDGTVIVFDEYLNFPGWREHEHKAFTEFVERTGKSYACIGVTALMTQVAVRIGDVGSRQS